MVGRTISRYRVLSELGSGGMGLVFRAHDGQLDRDVALKLLRPDTLADSDARSRLLREARLASKLNHPNICTVYEVGESADGQVYIAMELVEGESLSARLARGALPAEEASRYGRQLADALAHAHARGVIHRDLKSANVVITPEGRAKVLDFGVAKHRSGEARTDAETQPASTLTGAGLITGTLAYMAPELLLGHAADERSDIWALGIVLYEMTGGRRPFEGTTGFELSAAILNDPVPPPPRPLPGSLGAAIDRCLAKDPAKRFQRATDLHAALDVPEPGTASHVFDTGAIARVMRTPRVVVPLTVALVLTAALASWIANERAGQRWAADVALPEIERLIDENDVWRNLVPAYRLAEEAERHIPDDPRLARLFSRCALDIDVTTEPAGASVAYQEYSAPGSEWTELGITPLTGVRVPIGVFRWRFEKDGYETAMAVSSSWDVDPASRGVVAPYDLHRVLDERGSAPAGMVRVDSQVAGHFYIDRHEVTNRQFRAFVDAGGYHDRRYWTQPFFDGERELTWEEAITRLVDPTGRPGPSSWQGGSYEPGQDEHPVAGVSWYEAAAYAEFAGRSLPTNVHWDQARGAMTPLIRWPQLGGNAVFLPFSNFAGAGSVPVGSLPGITAFGAADMAGNVREWCFNETPRGRLLRGGGWEDNVYMFGYETQAPPLDRSATNGFRLARYMDDVPASVLAPVALGEERDVRETAPVPDPIFEVYRAQFDYDRTDLRAKVEERHDSPGGWIRERISFDAAYDGERVLLHLFVPTHVSPPYQAVVYLPGSASLMQASSHDIESYYEFPMFLSFVLTSGRAVAYPVYKGTFERSEPPLLPLHLGADTHQYTDFLVQVVQDFRRTVDYLAGRDDIDAGRLAYYGMSWGGVLGAIVPAVEPRLRASVLTGAGLTGRGRPEANQINYVTRVRTPTLILGGRYDARMGNTITAMFDLLGTPAEHKQLKLYETDHIPPRTEMIKETLAWLDRYLGPVRASK